MLFSQKIGLKTGQDIISISPFIKNVRVSISKSVNRFVEQKLPSLTMDK
jgi:hypothetical protein